MFLSFSVFFEQLLLKNSADGGPSEVTRRYSRRYTQIKKLRHCSPSDIKPVPGDISIAYFLCWLFFLALL